MKSASHGKHISAVEVTNISPHGFWLLVQGREVFASFKDLPWFRDASIGELTNVELPSPHHLYWPALDVDLAVDSLDHPERYPLMSHVRHRKQARPTTGSSSGTRALRPKSRRGLAADRCQRDERR